MALIGFFILVALYLLLELVMFKNKISVYMVLCIMAAAILGVTSVLMGGITADDWINLGSNGPLAFAAGTMLFAMYGMFGGILKGFGVIDEFVKWSVSLAKSKGTTLIIAMLIVASMVAVLGGGGFAMMAMVIPLLLAFGLDKKQASVFAVQINCITYFLTVTIYAMITPLTGLGMNDLTKMAVAATCCILLTSIGYIIFVYKKYKPVMDAEMVDKILSEGGKPKFKVTYLLPIVPVLLIWVFKLNAYLAFLISIFAALIICALVNRCSLEEFTGLCVKSLTGGINDVAGLLSVNVFLGLIVTVVKIEPVANMFNSAISAIIPGGSKIGMFAVLAIFMLVGCAYRGVGNLTGLGYGICVALMSMPMVTPQMLGSIMISLTVMGLLNDPCVAYALYANGISKCEHSKYFTASFVPAAICSLACLAIAVFIM